MLIPSEDQIVHRFSELFSNSGEHDVSVVGRSEGPGTVRIRVGSRNFVVEPKTSGAVAPVAAAIEQLRKYPSSAEGLIPVVAVPYMGEVGKNLCDKDRINWIDLAGNAHLNAPGLLIHVDGRPNLFKDAGRPLDVFAPKSSRITRSLLANWISAWSPEELGRRAGLAKEIDSGPGVRELARSTDLDPGLASRVITRLLADGLIQGMRHKADGRLAAVKASKPGLLLDAWRDQYNFFRHDVLQGNMPVRSAEELLRNLERSLSKAKIRHAATGLGAAWAFTHFAAFRLVTFYVSERPTGFLRDIGFQAGARGANVWLVVPNDDGVFQETRTPRWYDPGASDELNDLKCVHPVQIYVDLKHHPERAADAAAELARSPAGMVAACEAGGSPPQLTHQRSFNVCGRPASTSVTKLGDLLDEVIVVGRVGAVSDHRSENASSGGRAPLGHVGS